MPWYAHSPAGHPNHADPGSELEAVLLKLGYVEIPAPGSDEPEETGHEGDLDDTADGTEDAEPEERAEKASLSFKPGETFGE